MEDYVRYFFFFSRNQTELTFPKLLLLIFQSWVTFVSQDGKGNKAHKYTPRSKFFQHSVWVTGTIQTDIGNKILGISQPSVVLHISWLWMSQLAQFIQLPYNNMQQTHMKQDLQVFVSFPYIISLTTIQIFRKKNAALFISFSGFLPPPKNIPVHGLAKLNCPSM